jgi:hypothetical protein
MRISEAQDKAYRLHNRICAQHNPTWPPVVTVVDMLEEAGEVADAVKNLEGYSPTSSPTARRSSQPSWRTSLGVYSSWQRPTAWIWRKPSKTC